MGFLWFGCLGLGLRSVGFCLGLGFLLCGFGCGFGVVGVRGFGMWVLICGEFGFISLGSRFRVVGLGI